MPVLSWIKFNSLPCVFFVQKKALSYQVETLKREISSALHDRDKALKECNDLREKYGDFIAQKESNSGGLAAFESNTYTRERSFTLKISLNLLSCWLRVCFLLFVLLHLAETRVGTIKLKFPQVLETCMENHKESAWIILIKQIKNWNDSASKLINFRLSSKVFLFFYFPSKFYFWRSLFLVPLKISYFIYLSESTQEAEVSKRRRDWAFSERDKIVLERESIRTLCDKLRKERDRAVSDLAEALRDSDDIKKQRNEASKELKQLK